MKNHSPIRCASVSLSFLLSACTSTAPTGSPAPTTPTKPTASAAPSLPGERCAADPLPPDIVVFAEGMKAPNPSALPPPALTPEAIAADASGRIVVSCVITTEGKATQCVLHETLPYMSKAVLAAIETQTFEPARVNGNPHAVVYSFAWEYLPNQNTKVEPMPTKPSPFTSRIERPKKISGPTVRYTKEAICHGASGTMKIKCELTETGKVENCLVLRTVPYMEETVVKALEASTYTPVLFEGKPQRVSYTFAIRLVLP